ncbi:hypothetical protein GUJ93_ZPchr0006g42912 [Zizania palustris]|uniref:Uncharacterized protein n=1 Tax=Zizania palustris TaxID=103762 RepID=A0A8J5VWZ5_ZIZPA|nr:hypothetical protein GUJ93_ZPchr0006g42912 [Zizania palustris]
MGAKLGQDPIKAKPRQGPMGTEPRWPTREKLRQGATGAAVGAERRRGQEMLGAKLGLGRRPSEAGLKLRGKQSTGRRHGS